MPGGEKLTWSQKPSISCGKQMDVERAFHNQAKTIKTVLLAAHFIVVSWIRQDRISVNELN